MRPRPNGNGHGHGNGNGNGNGNGPESDAPKLVRPQRPPPRPAPVFSNPSIGEGTGSEWAKAALVPPSPVSRATPFAKALSLDRSRARYSFTGTDTLIGGYCVPDSLQEPYAAVRWRRVPPFNVSASGLCFWDVPAVTQLLKSGATGARVKLTTGQHAVYTRSHRCARKKNP